MGIDTLVELLVYIVVMQILTKMVFSVMAALIKGFRVQSHTQDPAAIRFYDEGGRPHQKNEVHNCGPFYLNKPSGLLVYKGKRSSCMIKPIKLQCSLRMLPT